MGAASCLSLGRMKKCKTAKLDNVKCLARRSSAKVGKSGIQGVREQVKAEVETSRVIFARRGNQLPIASEEEGSLLPPPGYCRVCLNLSLDLDQVTAPAVND